MKFRQAERVRFQFLQLRQNLQRHTAVADIFLQHVQVDLQRGGAIIGRLQTLGFILQDDRIPALRDPALVTVLHGTRVQLNLPGIHNQEAVLDRELQDLISLAPPKAETGGRIIPQMEEAIAHTEKEMAKVLDSVEAMLVGSDLGFTALTRLKQEAALGRIKGEEGTLAELERVGSRLQEEIFNLIQQLQFQDIARQKLERVLNHVRGLQMVVGAKFRDAKI